MTLVVLASVVFMWCWGRTRLSGDEWPLLSFASLSLGYAVIRCAVIPCLLGSVVFNVVFGSMSLSGDEWPFIVIRFAVIHFVVIRFTVIQLLMNYRPAS